MTLRIATRKGLFFTSRDNGWKLAAPDSCGDPKRMLRAISTFGESDQPETTSADSRGPLFGAVVNST